MKNVTPFSMFRLGRTNSKEFRKLQRFVYLSRACLLIENLVKSLQKCCDWSQLLLQLVGGGGAHETCDHKIVLGLFFVVVVGTELLERTAFFGISLNLVTYLVTVLHQGTEQSISTVYNWSGTAWILPLLGGFIADAYWGRFWTITVFAVVYLLVT
jgi:hypothetical protein